MLIIVLSGGASVYDLDQEEMHVLIRDTKKPIVEIVNSSKGRVKPSVLRSTKLREHDLSLLHLIQQEQDEDGPLFVESRGWLFCLFGAQGVLNRPARANL